MPDITHYLRERDRLQRFRDATAGQMTVQDSRFLAALIRQMVSAGRHGRAG
jgi:hypothetical protein